MNNPIKEWLPQQARMMAGEWERTIDQHYPQYSATWRDPSRQWQALTMEWNLYDAVKFLDWNSLLSKGPLKVLDLGGGTGWLSAYLSRYPQIESIDLLDSSTHNLNVMLPKMIEFIGGDASKIQPILGFFSPLPIEDATYDVIVASSALHHSTNLTATLRECDRVLRPSGVLVALNETPLSRSLFVFRSSRIFINILADFLSGRYGEVSPAISSSGILYDPYLGDHSYSWDQWRTAFQQAGFVSEAIATSLPVHKSKKPSSAELAHFIARKVAP